MIPDAGCRSPNSRPDFLSSDDGTGIFEKGNLMRSQSWILDPKLRVRMGDGPYRLLQIMVNHAYRHRGLFTHKDAPWIDLPFMSTNQMAKALGDRFPKKNLEDRRIWASRKLKYLQHGGVGGGWIKVVKRIQAGNPKGATRFRVPSFLLVEVSVSFSSGVSGFNIKPNSKSKERPEILERTGPTYDLVRQAGGLGALFQDRKLRAQFQAR